MDLRPPKPGVKGSNLAQYLAQYAFSKAWRLSVPAEAVMCTVPSSRDRLLAEGYCRSRARIVGWS